MCLFRGVLFHFFYKEDFRLNQSTFTPEFGAFLIFVFFYSKGTHMGRGNYHKFPKIGKNDQIHFFIILYRNNQQGCSNQKLFLNTHTLSVLPKKISRKTDKLFLPRTYLKSAYFLHRTKFFLFYNTPNFVQRPKIKNRLLTISSVRPQLSFDIYMLGSLMHSEVGKIKVIPYRPKKRRRPEFSITPFK